MKSLLKWTALLALPSLLIFFLFFRELTETTREQKALFLTIHYTLSGVAIFFVLRDFKRDAEEEPGMIRYVLTGIMTAVMHGIWIGVVSALYFNAINPEVKEVYIQEELLPRLVRSHDSTANTPEEWKDNLLSGVDSGVLMPDVYEKKVQAAEDSMQLLYKELEMVSANSFGYFRTTMNFVGFAPLIGILFSIIITIFVLKKR